eukprot:jgi/Phyca11/113293/e_gw1.24.438.1
MYKELPVSSEIPESKLKRAFKTGILSLKKDELAGSGATLHLHPESYTKAIKARNAGKGTLLSITKKEISYPFKHMQGSGMYGASIFGKIWDGIKSSFKFAKDTGLLSKAVDAAVPALSTALGAPSAAVPVRGAIKSLTGVGVQGGRISLADVKRTAKSALSYAKRKGVITDALDEGERYLLTKATKPEHETMIKSVRTGIKQKYGVGIAKSPKFVKGSPEAKAHMAKLRAMKKKPLQGASFRL